MNAFAKAVIFSFPVVFVVVLWWPGCGGKPTTINDAAEKDGLLKASPVSENDKAEMIRNPPTESPEAGIKKNGGQEPDIYRWVDENGRVVFSDRPAHADVVAYNPNPLVTLSVSAEVKRRPARQQYQSAQAKQALIVGSESRKTRDLSAGSSGVANGYRFSNTSAGQQHKYVLLTGRISGGPACRNLVVTATAGSDKGSMKTGRDRVGFSGSGSALYEIKVRSGWNGGKQRRPQWKVVSVSADCQN